MKDAKHKCADLICACARASEPKHAQSAWQKVDDTITFAYFSLEGARARADHHICVRELGLLSIIGEMRQGERGPHEGWHSSRRAFPRPPPSRKAAFA